MVLKRVSSCDAIPEINCGSRTIRAAFRVLLAVASFAAGSANASDDFTLGASRRVLKLQKPVVDGIGMVTIAGTGW
jgi:hypothetical protein